MLKQIRRKTDKQVEYTQIGKETATKQLDKKDRQILQKQIYRYQTDRLNTDRQILQKQIENREKDIKQRDRYKTERQIENRETD